ncbi:uncharacterized protein [Engystomops pustulosus]|uniref:uncharacterized protein isoform X3 n=1 Tax=Engystomops pustulosus TaxID=76066 RepID=UPI003AFB5B49
MNQAFHVASIQRGHSARLNFLKTNTNTSLTLVLHTLSKIQNSSVYYSADKKSSSTGELNFQKILQWQNLISRQVNGKHLEKTKSSSNNLKKLYATIGKQTLLVCVGTKHDKEKSLLCQLMPYMPYNTQDPLEKRTASADKDDD